MPTTFNLCHKYRLGNLYLRGEGGIGTVTAYGAPIKSGFKVGSRDSEIPLRSESLRPTGELNLPFLLDHSLSG